MYLINYLKHIVRSNPYYQLYKSRKNWRNAQRSVRQYDDVTFLKNTYQRNFNKPLDLDNPVSFNEKLQWLKINYSNPLVEQLSDKYTFRDYVKQQGYGHLLNPILFSVTSAKDIKYSDLPDKFVLKASHGSGWNIICKDKRKFNLKVWRKVLDSWLKQNYYCYYRETNYKNLKPRIICEKYIETHTKEGLLDYKLYCIDGKFQFFQMIDNSNWDKRINLYDKDWNLLPVGYAFKQSDNVFKKPDDLEQMIKIAEDLSKSLPFVRVDLYNYNRQIIFGEFTFFPSAGLKLFSDDSFDIALGQSLKLPVKS